MKQTRKKVLIICVIVSLAITYIHGKVMDQYTQETTNMVYSYQNTYVGDNSSVGGILYQLPLGDSISSFELGTQEEPYSITLNYNENASAYENISNDIEYIATALFALVINVDEVSINIPGSDTKRISRESIQLKCDHDLSYYVEDEERWNAVIRSQFYD
jgi:hypothetical protein